MSYTDLMTWDNAADVGELVDVEGMPCALVDLCMRDAYGQRTNRVIATLNEHVRDVYRVLGKGMPPVVGVASQEALNIVALLPLQLAMFIGEFREAASGLLLRMADPMSDHPHDPHSGSMQPEDIKEYYARPTIDRVVERLMNARRRYRSVNRALHQLHKVHTGRENIDDLVHGFFDTAGSFLRLAGEYQRCMQEALVEVAIYIMGQSRCVSPLRQDILAWMKQQIAGHAKTVHLWRGALTPAKGKPVAPGDGTLAGWDNTEEAGQAAMRMACLMLGYPQVSFGRNAYEVATAGTTAGHVRQAFALMSYMWDVLDEGGYPAMLRSPTTVIPDGAIPPAQLLSPEYRVRLATRLREIPQGVSGRMSVPGYMPVAVGSEAAEIIMVKTSRGRPLPGDKWIAGATRWLLEID